MRWRYLEPNDPDDAAFRRETLACIDAWWDAFSRNVERLDLLFRQKEQWDLPDWMAEHLGAVAHLNWEYGPGTTGDGHRLVITPEGEHGLRPLTETVIDRAPDIPRWEFFAYRIPEPVDTARQLVEVRSGGDISDATVEVSLGEHGTVNLCYRSPRWSGPDDEQARNDAIIATEALLGEKLLDTHVGGVVVDRATGSEKQRSIPLDRVYDVVRSLIDSRLEQLPHEPHLAWARDAEWTGLKGQPQPADDYPGQSDIFVATTPNPDMWMATKSHFPFASERFTRCGETFCYVKLDGEGRPDEDRFTDKTRFSDLLNEALGETGCEIGGGTGLRYSYIELALADLDAGLERVRRCLGDEGVSRLSWILFHDAYLCDEWIGVYEDSPEPPRFEGE